MRQALTKAGLSALDGRSKQAQAAKRWKAAIARDLGGQEALSQAQRTILDLACTDAILVDEADSWLREAGGRVLNRRSGKLRPIVEQRARLAKALVEKLTILGLERKASPETIAGWLERTAPRAPATDGPGGTPRTPAVEHTPCDA